MQTRLLAFYARVLLPPRICDDNRRADLRDVLQIFDRFPTAPNHVFFVEACPNGFRNVSASTK